MAEIAVAPGFFTGTLTLSGNGYTAHVSSAQLVPTARTGTYIDLGGVDHHFGGKSSWSLQIEHAQDYKTTNSLSQLALANDGVLVSGELVSDDMTASFEVLMSASTFGGAFGSLASGSLTLPTTYPVFAANE